ncbi:MAG: class I SAM-dependent methyltransferase [Candidatus Thermoplasmatota archaeon]|jgi:SAM-dependent methyltransferase|nr:class I SAM-dependent methyltransferase [Candidatus Thermoplasmatota archaeon]MCL5789946.1 class I SAM-dependent methyltransferase [Candidatus Thermoplasmatota archaeon]
MSQVEDFYDFESTYYDRIYGVFGQDIALYKALRATPPFLEIFAGTGRIISRFDGGIGLEINPNMLRRSSNSFIKVMGDSRFLPFKKHFNTVIIGLNSLLLVPNEQKRTILKETRRVLQDAGSLFVDVINGFSLRRGTYDISEFNDGETAVTLTMRARRMRDSYQLRYSYNIVSKTRRVVEKTITIYPVTPPELREMLETENFELEGTFGDYDLSPFSKGAEKLIVKARAI